jgi:glycosyltransferase involved in cell wall biosynthesis
MNFLPSTTHLVLIPSFNPGAKVFETVRAARAHWSPVWVVVDGSNDGTERELQTMAARDPGLHVIVQQVNTGKGAALLRGLREAQALGFTHVLAMDSDGQHPAEQIPAFMAASVKTPAAMILGDPIFDSSAPRVRVMGRKISNFWTNLETLWAGIHDSLFGFRVYPIAPLVEIMRSHRWMRRYDFDAEAAVRLCWSGIAPLNLPAPVKYFAPREGGVSHFNYLRDNVVLTWMHVRLFCGFLLRLPVLLVRRAMSI